MRENVAETVYAAEWPGFPGETDARQRARADLRVVDEGFSGPALPADALAINEVLRLEETAAFEEADESGIYNYEIEMQRPVPRLEEVSERVSWRKRTMRFMSRASEALKEASVTTLATAQAKAEEFYGDEENGTKRKKITGAVAGALALGVTTYLGSKGLVSSGSSPMRGAETIVETKAASLANHLDFTPFQHIASTAPGHHEHARQAAETTLHSGDTPWSVTEAQLHAHGVAHPSDARIAADDARLIKLNHISPLQAMKLHIGTKLQLLKKW